LYLR